MIIIDRPTNSLLFTINTNIDNISFFEPLFKVLTLFMTLLIDKSCIFKTGKKTSLDILLVYMGMDCVLLVVYDTD